MPILRISETGFTQVSNEILRNKSLSWKARGILSYLLSCKDGWNFSLSGVCALSDKDGMNSLRTGIEELKKAGYLEIKPVQGDGGKFLGQEWYIYNRTTVLSVFGSSVKPNDGESTTNNTMVDNNNKKNNTMGDSSIDSDFDEWYEIYPRKKARGFAKKAYRSARTKIDKVTLYNKAEELKALVEVKHKEIKYIPYPASWLNGECWTDPEEKISNNQEPELWGQYA